MVSVNSNPQEYLKVFNPETGWRCSHKHLSLNAALACQRRQQQKSQKERRRSPHEVWQHTRVA